MLHAVARPPPLTDSGQEITQNEALAKRSSTRRTKQRPLQIKDNSRPSRRSDSATCSTPSHEARSPADQTQLQTESAERLGPHASLVGESLRRLVTGAFGFPTRLISANSPGPNTLRRSPLQPVRAKHDPFLRKLNSRPIRERLLADLERIFADSQAPEAERLGAANAISRPAEPRERQRVPAGPEVRWLSGDFPESPDGTGHLPD